MGVLQRLCSAGFAPVLARDGAPGALDVAVAPRVSGRQTDDFRDTSLMRCLGTGNGLGWFRFIAAMSLASFQISFGHRCLQVVFVAPLGVQLSMMSIAVRTSGTAITHLTGLALQNSTPQGQAEAVAVVGSSAHNDLAWNGATCGRWLVGVFQAFSPWL